MSREIILGANQCYVCLVSDEDYEWLVQWKWQYKVSEKRYQRTAGHKGVYAKRTTTVEGRKVTLLMSHVILKVRRALERPGPDFDADHMDGDSLNNRRDNLQWLHQSPNRACAQKHYAEAA